MNTISVKLILRNLKRNKLHSIINIVGFSIGIAVFTVIILYAQFHFSFDKFHTKSDNIYELYIGDYGGIPAPIVNQINEKFPKIENSVRYTDWYGGGSEGYFVTDDNKFKTTDLLFVDKGFFDLLDFKLLYGDASRALETPNAILLTESQATKIFGDKGALGKHLTYKSIAPAIEYNLTVAGIVEDAPANSSIQYNGILSMSTIVANNVRSRNMEEDWGNWGFSTLVQVNNIRSFEEEFGAFWADFIKERWNIEPGTEREKEYALTFVPITQLHFQNNARRTFLYVLVFIAFIILTIAVINYINLSISIFSNRMKEIGIKKIIGSDRSSLIRTFISESVFITLASALLAAVLIIISYPLLSSKIGLEQITIPGGLVTVALAFIVGAIFIGAISGIYPALRLTSLQPLNALKNKTNNESKTSGLKYAPIVFQFTVSIILISSVFVISRQMNFMQSKELGFNHEQMIYFSQSKDINEHYSSFKESLAKNPQIKSVCRINSPLGDELNITSKFKVNGEDRTYYATTIDPDFVETFGLQLVEGRNVSWDIGSDINAVLVNEKFIGDFDLQEPIGKEIEFLGQKVKIVGVIQDFHNNSLQHEIKPCVYVNYDWNANIHVLLNTGSDPTNTIASIEETWQSFSPDSPFEFHFLDDTFDKLYKTEKEFKELMMAFSSLAIFIACLGLFGLVSYISNQRTKEIGVRKVNGAKVSEILVLLNKSFVGCIAIAFVIATPLAWYTMNKWLENFAYKTELSWWIFALAGILALGIALLTVSFQSWKAATRNPVEALRYE